MPGIIDAHLDHENPVRVLISPSQSSFFAGEPFSVTITFTNTRSPEAGPSKNPEQAYPQIRTHKRWAHSISSAPLARPPTSPGTPRTILTPSPRKLAGFVDDALPRRRGLIGTVRKGHQDGQLPQLIEQRRKKLLAKSLSVSISSQELEEQLGEGIIAATPSSAPFSQQSFSNPRQTPTAPHIPSPLSRTNALSLSSNHPHARKASVLDGQLSLDMLSPTTSIPPRPHTPSTPLASLSLSTISESSYLGQHSTSSLSSPSTPRTSSPLSPSYSQPAFQPSAQNPNAVQAYPSRASSGPHHTHRISQQMHLGLGPPPGIPRTQTQRNVFSSPFPNSGNEFILYSYAQLVGTVLIAPEGTGAVPPTQEQINRMNKIRRALVRRRVVIGGGSMDISQSLHSSSNLSSSLSGSGSYYTNRQPAPGPGPARRTPAHGRSASLSAGLLSLLSPAHGPIPPAMGERASTTSPSHLNGTASPAQNHKLPNGSGQGGGTGLGLDITDPPSLDEQVSESIDPELPLPTFEAQPSMLAVDLSLSPGESKSYTYTIKLPDLLPPTYKGKAIRFSYELVVGTCRAVPSTPMKSSFGGAGPNSISRVMKVPIRVYNHVTVDRPPQPYDILWPVSHHRPSGLGKGREKEIPETQGKVFEDAGMTVRKAHHLSPSKPAAQGSFEDLRRYTKRLASSLPPTLGHGMETQPLEDSLSPSITMLPSTFDKNLKISESRISMDEARELEEEDCAIAGCREAVEILTRLPKKASYDVNKDGIKVAVLTFSKSAYRLGETVSGIVELNDRVGRARVLQLCAILEAHETLPSSVAPPSSARSLKRTYGEHYASFTLNTLRTTFALDIPSDASPAFQVNIDNADSYAQPPLTTIPTSLGGLEWKIRLCLLVAIASESSELGTEGVRFRSLERDGPRGEWGSSWRAPKNLAPLEKPRVDLEHLKKDVVRTKSWTQFFVDSVWNTLGGVGVDEELHDGSESEAESGVGDERSYDGIKPDFAGGVGMGVDFSGGEEGWKEVKLQTVECEVPIKVLPGNTAFRAVDVVFDV